MVGSPPHATSCCAGRVKPGVFTHLRRDARLRPDLEQAGVWNGWTPLTSGYGPRSGQRLTGLTSCFAPAPQVRFGQARTRSSPRPNGLRTMHGKTTGVCHIFNLGWVCCAASHAGCGMRGTVVASASTNCRTAAKVQERPDAKRLGGGDEVPGYCFPFFTSPPRTDVTAPYRSYRPVMPYTSDFVVFAPTPSENRPACTGWSSARP
jgi:hypothetical protein